MNKVRRNNIYNIITKLEEIKDLIDSIRAEEQDYMDSIPENLQESEKYTKAEEAVSYLEEAAYSIDEAIEKLNSAIE